jgi:hypothetical protein
MKRWFEHVLRFPRVLYCVALLAVALALPSLFADFYCDDQVMVLELDGVAPAAVPGPFHLYSFFTGAPSERQTFVEHGALPWWTIPGLKLSFFRPLSSGLFALDHALAGHHPLPYHLHSIAWYAAAAMAASLLLRRLLPEREAAFAALLFATSPAHWMLAAWPSARHVAVSGLLAVVALILHFDAREQPGARSSFKSMAAILCAALALSACETALGVFGYVLAYEMIGRRDAFSQRLRALAPWGALLLGYAALYKGFGFGVQGSGAYIDPIAQPGTYLTLLPERLAFFLNAALLGVPSELSGLAPSLVPILVAMGVTATIAFAALLKRVLRTAAPGQARTLAWLFAGALLALLPGAASIPGDRVLFLPNLAIVSGLSFVLLRGWTKGAHTFIGALPARVGVALFGISHVVLAPLSFAFGGAQLASTSHAALAAASRAEIPTGAGVNVLGIGLSDPLVGMYLQAALWTAPRPEPRPRNLFLLSMSDHAHLVTRTDERTLELQVQDGTLLETALERVFRPPNAPLRAGDTVPLGAWSVRILDDTSGRPVRFSVTFDRSVDDPSLAFLVWRSGALRAFIPPKLGEHSLVRHEAGPMGL